MARRHKVIGGPLCGLSAPPSADTFRLIDAEGRTYAADRAEAGRHLYEQRGSSYRWPGHGTRLGSCGGCIIRCDPATGRAPEQCPLCGA